MSSPLKFMSTSYICGSLDDEDGNSMEGSDELMKCLEEKAIMQHSQRDDLYRHKTNKKYIFSLVVVEEIMQISLKVLKAYNIIIFHITHVYLKQVNVGINTV